MESHSSMPASMRKAKAHESYTLFCKRHRLSSISPSFQVCSTAPLTRDTHVGIRTFFASANFCMFFPHTRSTMFLFSCSQSNELMSHRKGTKTNHASSCASCELAMVNLVNINARDRAIAAHAAAARYGKESPLAQAAKTPVPSRPSSAGRHSARPSSATTTGTAGTGRTTGSGRSGKTTPSRSPWGVGHLMPRSFVEIAANQHIDFMELQLGPKEVKFRELGAKLEADAMEAAAVEAVLAKDGQERRRKAENACRENRNSSGDPWRHGRHGGHQGESANPPLHLPSRRGRSGAGCAGLFSAIPPLEATESALRRSQIRTRPSSAQHSRSQQSRLSP